MNKPLAQKTLVVANPITIAIASLFVFNVATNAAEQFQLSDQITNTRVQSEDVQWVPASITIIKKADVDAGYRRTLEDLQGYVPGMIFDSLGGTPQGAAIAIRGIQSSRTSKGFEPAVAVSIDGVYVGTHSGQSQVLFDFEQIEISRGPQGTFHGAPAQAGSINIQRTKPTGELGVVTRFGFRDLNQLGADFVANFPIMDGLAGKISGSVISGEDGDITNTFNGDENEQDLTTASLSVLWDKRDDISIQYTFDIELDDSDTPALINLSTATDLVCIPRPQDTPAVSANCGGGGNLPESGDLTRTLQNGSNSRTFEGSYHTIRIEADYTAYKITSITGFRSTEESFELDLDATSVDFYSSEFDQNYDQFSTELTVETQLPNDSTIILGGYWLNMDYDLKRIDRYIIDNLVNAALISANTLPNQVRAVDSKLESSITSAFIWADYPLNESWKLDAGARLNHYTKNFDHIVSPIATTSSAGTALVISEDEEWYEISGHTSISYKVDESAMIYASFAIDHNPGGYNDNANSLESATYADSESTTSFEIGMKSDWLEDRLRLNMAFYHNYQDDKIEDFANLASNGAIEASVASISELEVRGFDLEFEYAPTEQLFFKGAYSHMNSSYQHYQIPDLANPGTTLDIRSTVVSQRAPTDIYYLTSQYVFPLASGHVKLFAGYRYVTDYITNPLLPGIGKVRGFTTWDLSASYSWKQVTLRLFSQNVNDKRYLINANTTYASQITPISGQTATQGISTYSEVNRPQYSGFEVIWTPNL